MMRTKNIGILGSTGSIGKNSLEVISNLEKGYRIVYLTTNKNIELLEKQIKEFKPKAVAVIDKSFAMKLKKRINNSVQLFSGEEGLLQLIESYDVEVVINSLVGFAGLRPTVELIKRGVTIALANKETLVAAGDVIKQLLRKHKTKIIPIDSEHSAILQCLVGEKSEFVSRLILTASGGPFLSLNKNKFHKITVEEALKHPNWKMGSKITIDSATLMNKGLEVIEAHWLFDLPPEKIDVLIHPQSIIHSMVEFIDGSIKAQLGVPDMKLPIQYALTYPKRVATNYKRINFNELKKLTFLQPDLKKFKCLQLAYDSLKKGGTSPAVMSAANEEAVELFLKHKISFEKIPLLIQKVLEIIPLKSLPSLDDIIEADREARILVKNIYRNLI